VINTLDVIWNYDTEIHPSKWKMVACIQPDCGYFFRINTRPWPPAIKLEKTPHHEFLKWDSYLECNRPLELDEYTIEQSIKRTGVIGRIHASLATGILAEVRTNITISLDDKSAIGIALGCVKINK
jgi:hypothetical protein